MPKVAVVQRPPVLLNLEASMQRAVEALDEAAKEGADLVVLPEAFLPGYPTWGWRLRPGGDMGLISQIHRRLLDNAVDLEADGLAPLREAARSNGVTVVCGIHERDGRYSRATIFNTVVVIGPEGALLNRHRKLIPTNPERTIWGRGDASGLRVVPTPAGRIATLPCWEAYMPLARYAVYAEGVEVFVSPTWDSGERWLATMRHIAAEGGCWVVSCASAMQGKDVPADFPSREEVFPDDEDWLCRGDSVVMEPFGGPVAGPLDSERGILYADYDLDAVAAARRSFDVVGHYMRPDVFRLEVNRGTAPPIVFSDEPPTDS